ncbi:MAG: DUF72 domain-containing protein [Armatimonadota bacterium]
MTHASTLYVGTSGWSYPSGYGKWKGVFYPKRWGGDELTYYAERFPAVEVNSSFYRLPSREIARGWVERTPKDFLFAVKLYRKFTHPEFFAREEGASPEIQPQDIAAMRGVLDELAERGRLGALLVQYADFFHKKEETVSAVVRTLDYFRDYPLAVELRNASWENAQTREILDHFKAAYVRIDEPFFANLDAPHAPHDSLQYWRFHGRNTEHWRKPGANAQRYDYLYAPEEIDGLAEAIQRHVNPDTRSMVFFNNHPGGKGAANAVEIAACLGLPLPYQRFANLAESFPQLRPLTGEKDGQLSLG